MKKTLAIIISLFLVVCLFVYYLSTNMERPSTLVYEYVFVKYTDSTYTNQIDSNLFTQKSQYYSPNSLFSDSTLTIQDGFYSVNLYSNTYNNDSLLYSTLDKKLTGQIKNNKRVGTWKLYTESGDTLELLEVRTFDNNGKLDGPLISFYSGSIFSINQYKNDQEAGIQTFFHNDSCIAYQYEIDSCNNHSFINKIIALKESGDTLFYTNLGKEGTGYIKFFDKWGFMEWEGMYINQRREGLHRNYVRYYGDDIPTLHLESVNLYKSDTLLKSTVYPTSSFDKLKHNADSAIYYYKPDFECYKIEFYRKGQIVEVTNK